MCYWSLDLKFKAKLKLESGNWKIQYRRQAAILKVTLLKINRLLSIYTSDVPWKFGLDIQSQTKVRFRKPKDPRWPPGAILKVTSLKIDRPLPMATNIMHIKFEIEMPKQTWVMLRKPCRLQTGGQTNRQIDGQGESSITPPPPPPPQPLPPPPPSPSTSLGGGINTKHCRLKWRGSQSTYVADNIFFKGNEIYEIG